MVYYYPYVTWVVKSTKKTANNRSFERCSSCDQVLLNHDALRFYSLASIDALWGFTPLRENGGGGEYFANAVVVFVGSGYSDH